VKYAVLGLLIALILAGCGAMSYENPSPAFTPQAECLRNGGYWRPGMNYCEYGKA
jgi:hypothetical protein